jgi:antitoxin MazE
VPASGGPATPKVCFVKVPLVAVGNSRGIRIPKALIEECGLGDMVELRAEQHRLVIEAERRPRDGWKAAFRDAGPSKNDELLLDKAAPNAFDRENWQW